MRFLGLAWPPFIFWGSSLVCGVGLAPFIFWGWVAPLRFLGLVWPPSFFGVGLPPFQFLGLAWPPSVFGVVLALFCFLGWFAPLRFSGLGHSEQLQVYDGVACLQPLFRSAPARQALSQTTCCDMPPKAKAPEAGFEGAES